MTYHIVVGDEAAKPLLEAVASEPGLSGEVITLKDILHVGPIEKNENQSFSALRSEWWQLVAPDPKSPAEVKDVEQLLEVSNALNKSESANVWFWMAPSPADVCAYHWMLKYLGKHVGRIFIVNLANLPFLDESGKVFYPRSISALLPKELIKARKLARPITPAEIEMDGETWRGLVSENAGLRTYEGGKKLQSRSESYYDSQLLSILTGSFQKASRVLAQGFAKFNLPTGDTHLAWRLREMAASDQIELKGDTSRPYKEWEVRIPTGESLEASSDAGVTSQDAI